MAVVVVAGVRMVSLGIQHSQSADLIVEVSRIWTHSMSSFFGRRGIRRAMGCVVVAGVYMMTSEKTAFAVSGSNRGSQSNPIYQSVTQERITRSAVMSSSFVDAFGELWLMLWWAEH
jgi:hypothetical protein